MQDFIAQISQQWLQLPDCQAVRPDAATVHITSSAVAGTMDVDFFVHHSAFSAIRYEEGMQLETSHRLHAWITLRNADGNVIHHEVICTPARFAQLLHEWRTEPEAAPAHVVLKPIVVGSPTDAISANPPEIDQDLNPDLAPVSWSS